MGYKPQNTTGLLGLNPGRGWLVGFNESVIVSPTLQSLTCLMPAVINPISPFSRASVYFIFGVKNPHFSTIY